MKILKKTLPIVTLCSTIVPLACSATSCSCTGGGIELIDLKNGFDNTLPRYEGKQGFADVNAAIDAYVGMVQDDPYQLRNDIYSYSGFTPKSVNIIGGDILQYTQMDMYVSKPTITLETENGPYYNENHYHWLRVSCDIEMHSTLKIGPFVAAEETIEKTDAKIHLKNVPFCFNYEGDGVEASTDQAGYRGGYYLFRIWTEGIENGITDWSIQDVDTVTDIVGKEETIVYEHNYTATDASSWDEGEGRTSLANDVGFFATSISPWLTNPTTRTATFISDYFYQAEYPGFVLNNVIKKSWSGEEDYFIDSITSEIGSSDFCSFIQTQEPKLNDLTGGFELMDDGTYTLNIITRDELQSGSTYKFNVFGNFLSGLGGIGIPNVEEFTATYN